MEYLFKHFKDFEEQLKNRRLFLFVDYDGTLTPIVEKPHLAVISSSVRNLLFLLSTLPGCRLAVVSGRALGNVKKKVNLKTIIYVGNHGLEIRGPKIKFKSPIAQDYRKVFGRLKNELTKRLKGIKGVMIEDKGLTLGVHYRLVKERQRARVKTIFCETTVLDSVRGKVKKAQGKMVLEIRPPIEWNKGKAVLWLCARQKYIGKNNKLSIYLGDDQTDEDAFRALNGKGITIYVGEKNSKFSAQYYLKNANDVVRFLKRILDIKTSERENG